MLDPSTGQVVTPAERYLATARLALDDGDSESAASRTYYALYHATILLLRLVRGITRERWDHDEMYGMFLEQFCKPGFRFNRRDGDDWARVKATRIAADYGRNLVNTRRAERSMARVERLVATIRVEVGLDA